LKQKGVNLNLANNLGQTAFYIAVSRGAYEIVRAMVDYMGDDSTKELFHKCTKSRQFPLYMSCFHGHHAVTGYLLNRKCDPKQRFISNNTSLHAACFGNHSKCVWLLLQHGADVHASTDEGFTPLHTACHKVIEKKKKKEQC